MQETVEETTKMYEKKHEIVDNCEETTMDSTTNYIHNGWKTLWQNRRKILAVAVMGIGLVLVLMSLFNIVFKMNVLQESGERFQEIKDDIIGLKIIDIIRESFLWSVGIMSLWLMIYELKSIFLQQKNSKRFWVIVSVYALLIILWLFDLLRLQQGVDVVALVICVVLVICIVVFFYEIAIYVIVPMRKFRHSGLILKQRLKTYVKIVFYATSYFLSTLIICYTIYLACCLVLKHLFFINGGDMSDFVWEYAEIFNYKSMLFACIVAFVLSTFAMNIFNNEIEKKIKGENDLQKNNN